MMDYIQAFHHQLHDEAEAKRSAMEAQKQQRKQEIIDKMSRITPQESLEKIRLSQVHLWTQSIVEAQKLAQDGNKIIHIYESIGMTSPMCLLCTIEYLAPDNSILYKECIDRK